MKFLGKIDFLTLIVREKFKRSDNIYTFAFPIYFAMYFFYV